jgi:hypothetical protein
MESSYHVYHRKLTIGSSQHLYTSAGIKAWHQIDSAEPVSPAAITHIERYGLSISAPAYYRRTGRGTERRWLAAAPVVGDEMLSQKA